MVAIIRTFILNPYSVALGLSFATLSMMFGSWVTRIPDLKAQFGLSEGQLGLVLLCLPVGSLLISPFSARIIHQIGLGKSIFLSAVGTSILMAIPTSMPTQSTLMIMLIIAGISNSLLNVSMNAAVSVIEKQENLKIMSTCHGIFSLTGFISALIGAFMVKIGVLPQVHLILVGFLMIILIVTAQKILFLIPNISSNTKVERFVIPKGKLIGLSIIGFAVMTNEGAVADWSAVYLKENIGSTAALASLGFAGFSLAMAVGRFLGDTLLSKWSLKLLLKAGMTLAIAGLSLSILLPYTFTALLGFTLVGLGLSIGVPIVFSLATKVEGVSAGAGIAAVSATATVGFLLGPPLIGFIAEELGLSVGLGFSLGLLVLALLLVRKKIED
jgi:fucose permease